jgi:hypothetical protein
MGHRLALPFIAFTVACQVVTGDFSVGAGANDSGASSADGGGTEAGPACLSTLSNVGTADFQIAFTLTTTATGLVALVNQRAGCDMTSTWWDVNMQNGAIGAATNIDPGGNVPVGLSAPVNDGQPHKIVVARTSGQLWYSIDSMPRSSGAPDPYAFGAFPPLAIGTDACPGYTALDGQGTISDLCITSSYSDAGAPDAPADEASDAAEEPAPPCSPQAAKCTSSTQMETCGTDGQWGVATTCTYACVGGSCGGVCAPGSTMSCSECTNAGTETCNSSGQWGTCSASCS